ncbi:MAG: UDP-N-acetylmuramoyl-L-alanine--D-glutamate ligase [Acidimicrobiaceae bacterium]|nr:UDP-N-acetylmuramoyl-L-alanine--D-glutamate ligase [Acidimicrobiaceae bacterium]
MRGSSLDLGKVVIVGYGVSGQAAHQALEDLGSEVIVIEDSGNSTLRELAKSHSALGVFRSEEIRQALDANWPALVVVSPGVRPSHIAFRYFNAPVISELELGWRMTDLSVVAITGTNGKTTVTSLVSAMLNQSSLNSTPCGNYGTPLVSLAGVQGWAVVEASSFQLSTISEFAPNVAAIVNVTPDHLDWHGGFQKYLEAKLRILENLGPDSFGIMPFDFAWRPTRGTFHTFTFGSGSGDFFASDTELISPIGVIAAKSDLKKALPHDILNFLAASACAVSAGASLDAIGYACSEFAGLEHRMEVACEFRGMRFINDSKATTPASVVAGLSGLGRCVLIAGGRNKGLDFEPLLSQWEKLAGVVVIGESADELAGLFAGVLDSSKIVRAASMAEAVRSAYALSDKVCDVILSPGATSFDWYSGYEQRGLDFKDCVRGLVNSFEG